MSDGKGAPAGVKPARYLYFVNAPVDYAMIGGLSIALFAVLWFMRYRERSLEVIAIAGWLVWFVNWPHFSATNYRLYHSRANIAQYPWTALIVPVLVVAGAIASFASPSGVAPAFVKLFLLWSPYHFSGQSLGISLIYARRAGFQVGKFERYALSGFIFGTFFFSQAITETGPDYGYYGVMVPSFGLPAWVADVSRIGMFACGAALAGTVLRWCMTNRRVLPPIVLLPALSQYIWFVPARHLLSFNEFVPAFHSLQYLLIAWSMQLKERMDMGGVAPSGRFVLSESARWGVINFLGGAGLFWLLPRLAADAGSSPFMAEGIVLSAVQIHHFFVDGVIWKLRNPKVGSPLLVNIEQMWRREPQLARSVP